MVSLTHRTVATNLGRKINASDYDLQHNLTGTPSWMLRFDSTGAVGEVDIAASSGAGLVGFIQTETGAGARTVQSKLRDIVSPMDFFAVGDGVADDRAALLAAMQSGRPVDGGGKSYAISSQMQPTSLVALRNCKLKWSSTAAMSVQQAMLYIVDLSNWAIEGNEFDLGTVTNTGSVNDSSRSGLSITSATPNVAFCDNVIVRGNRVKGNGNGTRIMVRSCRRSIVTGNIVSNGQTLASPDPTNDTMNGIEVTQSQNMVVANNVVSFLENSIAGVFRNHWSRGFLFVELHNSVVSNNTAYNVDQGFDFSGGIVATTNPEGNVGVTVVGNQCDRVRLFGLKFANVCRYFTVQGNVVRNYGHQAFVWSGGSGTLADTTKNTSHHIVMGNYAIDATGEYNGGGKGFQVGEQPANVGWPRAIRLMNNTIAQPSGATALTHGLFSDVVYDGASNNFNEAFDNKSTGHATAKQAGFPRLFARVGGGGLLAIPDITVTLVPFTGTEAEDSLGMHSTATEPQRITVPVAGWYRVKAAIEFAANATGSRTVYIYKALAVSLPGSSKAAIAALVTTPLIDSEILCAAGDILDIRVYQNSGAALNIDRDRSFFSAEFIRDV